MRLPFFILETRSDPLTECSFGATNRAQSSRGHDRRQVAADKGAGNCEEVSTLSLIDFSSDRCSTHTLFSLFASKADVVEENRELGARSAAAGARAAGLTAPPLAAADPCQDLPAAMGGWGYRGLR